MPPNYQALPWNAVIRGAVARVEAVRRAVGDDIDIGLDPHARIFEVGRALELCTAVAPYRPMFVEEPLRPENYDALAKLAAHTDVPLATGEMLYTKYEFRDLMKTEAVDIVQPDVCLMGGLWEMKKVAAMAEAHYMSVAPHNPCGPVATAVNVHFAASTQNFIVLEYHPDDEGPRREIVDEPMRLVDGYLELPERPGLALDLVEDALCQVPVPLLASPVPAASRWVIGVSITQVMWARKQSAVWSSTMPVACIQA